MKNVKWLFALVAMVVAGPGIAVALWVYALGLGLAGEAQVNQFMPIVYGMANALDEHKSWDRALETGCVHPLTRFGKQDGFYVQDVPSDYRPTYLDCVQPVMYGRCYFVIPSNCVPIAVHRFVLSQPEILNEIINAAIDPCRYEGKADQHVSYWLHYRGDHLDPKSEAAIARLNARSCERAGPVDYIFYVLNDDRTVFLKLSISKTKAPGG